MNQLNRLEKFLSIFNKVRAGEGMGIIAYGMYIFLIIVCYYLLKNIREAFILTEFSPEVRTYAVGSIALVLFLILPIYNYIFKKTNRFQLIRWITLFFVMNIAIFYICCLLNIGIGFVFFVWVGVFGVVMIAQFWAFTADSFNLKAGQRLFPIIMIGASLGGVVGPLLTTSLVKLLGPELVLVVAALVLSSTLLLPSIARGSIPDDSLCVDCDIQPSKFQNIFGGIAIVFQRRYLFLIALFVVILNCINSTGEYILSKHILAQAKEIVSVATDSTTVLSTVIVQMYSDFYFWVNTVGLIIQAFLVGRIYSFMGIGLSALIMPTFVLIGYLLIGFIPIFTIIYLFKIVENAIDYSIMNTTRQALFLPLCKEEKYHGKTAIDTFFWRFGDVVQAVIVYVGVQYLDFGTTEFIWFNVALCFVWLIISFDIIKHYRGLKKKERINRMEHKAKGTLEVGASS